MRQSRYSFYLLALSLMFAGSQALAEKTDPSMIPPDVTFSLSPVAIPAGSAAATHTGAAVPGLANGSAPALPVSGMSHASTMTVNGFAVPNSGKVTATMMKPPGTAFGMDGQAQPQGQPSLYQGSGVPVSENAPDPLISMNTSKGVIQMRLFRKYAPKTVDNFVDLVSRGFYNGLTFHRYEPGFCIQGGCPNGNGTGIYIDPDTHQARMLPLETSTMLKHNVAGVVAMAHSASPNSGSCQFYITLSPQPNLDGKYTVFGGVVAGMDAVENIRVGDKIISATVSAR